jgi:hypothetical protein
MQRLSLQIIFHASNGRYKPVLCVSESENYNSVIQSAFNIGRLVFYEQLKVVELYVTVTRLPAMFVF